MARVNIFDAADDAAGDWASITKRGHVIGCRLIVSATPRGKIRRWYIWRLNGKRVSKDVAMAKVVS